MKIRISNMLRVERAEIELAGGKITTVAGRNAAGKTSLATIAGALLCGEGNPAGASKGMGQVYLRDGSDAGTAELLDESGDVTVRWLAQSGEIAVLKAPASSPAAVGLVDFCGQLSPAARVKLWEEYFLPAPEVLEARIRSALAPYVNAKLLEDLMENARDEGGFDGIVKAYRSRIQDAKRAWTRVTGATWGVKKGADWLPEGWMADLDGRSRDEAAKGVEAAKAEVQAHQISHAVDATIIAQAAEAAEKVPAAQAEFNTAEIAHGEAVMAVQDAIDANKADADALKRAVQETRELQALCERLKGELDALEREKPEVPDGDFTVDNNASLAQARVVKLIEDGKPKLVTDGYGIGQRMQRLTHLRENPPQREKLPEGVPCPCCNAPLLIEDHGRALAPYLVTVAEKEADERHNEAKNQHLEECKQLVTEIAERRKQAENDHAALLAEWDEDLADAKRVLGELQVAARKELDETVERWMTTTAARQTELDEARARHATVFGTIAGLRAKQDQHEARMAPLYEGRTGQGRGEARRPTRA